MKILIVILSLVILASSISSRKINSSSTSKLINESCYSDKKCGSDDKLICVVLEVTHTCGLKECEFHKGQSLCKLKPDQACTEDQQCSSHKCENKKCGDYKRKFLENCEKSFFWSECEEGTICSETVTGDYRCLVAPDHKCKKDDECYNNSCGTGLFSAACNGFGGKVLRDSVAWLFKSNGQSRYNGVRPSDISTHFKILAKN